MALSDSAPLHILLNAGSGHNDCEATRTIIETLLTEAGRKHEISLIADPARLRAMAEDAVRKAKGDGGVVVAAGGDGTINAIAQVAHAAHCPFGVLPQGTFNYFGRTHGIPEDTADQVRALLHARLQPVQVGLVNDRIFLVNASVGLYPELLEDREKYKAHYGRSRFVALFAGIATILKQHRQLRITLEYQGRTRNVRTPTLFVGNNALQMQQIGIPPLAEALESGHLAGIMLKPIGNGAMLWLLLRGLLGKLGDAANVESFALKHLTVYQSRLYPARRLKVATDGEVTHMAAPLQFRVAPWPLQLLKPDAREASA